MSEGAMDSIYRHPLNQPIQTSHWSREVFSHFHFSLKKKLKASHCTRWESICICTSQNLAAEKNFLWHIGQRSPTSSCSWHCWAGQCQSIGFPCLHSMLDPRPGSPTSCHRSYLQVSQTQPENFTVRGERIFRPFLWVFRCLRISWVITSIRYKTTINRNITTLVKSALTHGLILPEFHNIGS